MPVLTVFDEVRAVRERLRRLVEVEERETLPPLAPPDVSPSTKMSFVPSGEKVGTIIAVVPRPHELAPVTSVGDAAHDRRQLEDRVADARAEIARVVEGDVVAARSLVARREEVGLRDDLHDPPDAPRDPLQLGDRAARSLVVVHLDVVPRARRLGEESRR